MEIFVSATWKIWNLRSSKIFDKGSRTIHLLVKKFKDQVYLQLVRVRQDKRLSIIQWLESITQHCMPFILYILFPCSVSKNLFVTFFLSIKFTVGNSPTIFCSKKIYYVLHIVIYIYENLNILCIPY